MTEAKILRNPHSKTVEKATNKRRKYNSIWILIKCQTISLSTRRNITSSLSLINLLWTLGSWEVSRKWQNSSHISISTKRMKKNGSWHKGFRVIKTQRIPRFRLIGPEINPHLARWDYPNIQSIVFPECINQWHQQVLKENSFTNRLLSPLYR